MKRREFWIWIAALAALFFYPMGDGTSLCVLNQLGVTECPGCGLGTSIHLLLHGQWSASWAAHPLGFPAVVILVIQIYRTFPLNKPNNRTQNEPNSSTHP